jgi:hypothetical protein
VRKAHVRKISGAKGGAQEMVLVDHMEYQHEGIGNIMEWLCTKNR